MTSIDMLLVVHVLIFLGIDIQRSARGMAQHFVVP